MTRSVYVSSALCSELTSEYATVLVARDGCARDDLGYVLVDQSLAAAEHNMGRYPARCPSGCGLPELQTPDLTHSVGPAHPGPAADCGKVSVASIPSSDCKIT